MVVQYLPLVWYDWCYDGFNSEHTYTGQVTNNAGSMDLVQLNTPRETMRTMPLAKARLQVQLSDVDKARIQEIAIKHETSVSELVRQWIRADGN